MSDEATTETEGATSEETGQTEESGTAELGDAGKKALDAIRAEKKAAEKKAKDLEAELDEMKRSQMTDQEKAIDEARAQARAEALAEAGSEIAAAEFRAAAAGRLDDDQVETLLGGLDVQAFLGDDGRVDKSKITDFMAKFAPEQTQATADLGQGARTTAVPLNGDPLLNDLKSKLGIR